MDTESTCKVVLIRIKDTGLKKPLLQFSKLNEDFI